MILNCYEFLGGEFSLLGACFFCQIIKRQWKYSRYFNPIFDQHCQGWKTICREWILLIHFLLRFCHCLGFVHFWICEKKSSKTFCRCHWWISTWLYLGSLQFGDWILHHCISEWGSKLCPDDFELSGFFVLCNRYFHHDQAVQICFESI